MAIENENTSIYVYSSILQIIKCSETAWLLINLNVSIYVYSNK